MAFSRARVAGVALAVAFLAVPLVSATLGSTYLLQIAARIAIYGIVALSLDLLVGWGGLISFGHAAFFGIGGYVVAIGAFHLADGSSVLGWGGTNELLIALPLAMIAAGLAAGVIGALSLRTSGVYFIMITLAFAQMLYFVFVALKYYGGDDGLTLATRDRLAGYRITDAYSFYYLCLAALAVCALFSWRLVGSRFGMVLRGAAVSERRMQAVGFPVFGYRLVAFVISGMLAGLGGALWVNLTRFASPDMMSWQRTGEFLIMVVLGGAGSLGGPILGGAVFLIVGSTLASATEHWEVFFGPFVIAVALFAPEGLWGLWGLVKDRR